MNKNLRIAVYARVSSQKQAEEMTIQSQLDELRQRIRADQLEVTQGLEFCDDGYTGSTLLRPALEQLRDQICSGLVDRLYVHSPDRLARNYAWQFVLLDECKRHDCEVIFLNQQTNDDSPESKLLLQMQGMISEYERAKILERTRRGRRFAARQGKISAIGCAPYGYRYIPKQEGDGEARWEIDPQAAPVVQQIFHWVCVEGLSLGKVVRRLAEQRIVTGRGKALWNISTIRGILLNPAYCGRAQYGKSRVCPRKTGGRPKRGHPVTPRQEQVHCPTAQEHRTTIPVPALIREELFALAAERMNENRLRQRERQEGTVYLLSGLLVCGCCGSAYCGQRPTGNFYYRCIGSDKYRRGGKAICQNTSIKGKELEEMIWSDVCDLLQDPDRLRRELQRRRESIHDDHGTTEKLERSITDLRARIARLIDAYTDGSLTLDEFKSRISHLRERLRREEAAYESHKRDSEDSYNLADIQSALDRFATDVAHHLDKTDEAKKRELLKLLIKRIEIAADEVRVVYKVPIRPFAIGPASGAFLQHRLELLCHPWEYSAFEQSPEEMCPRMAKRSHG
jgi:site-specific DNA recombinase